MTGSQLHESLIPSSHQKSSKEIDQMVQQQQQQLSDSLSSVMAAPTLLLSDRRSTPDVWIQYARMASVEQLDSNLAMLSNYSTSNAACSTKTVGQKHHRQQQSVLQKCPQSGHAAGSCNGNSSINGNDRKSNELLLLTGNSGSLESLYLSLITPPTTPDGNSSGSSTDISGNTSSSSNSVAKKWSYSTLNSTAAASSPRQPAVRDFVDDGDHTLLKTSSTTNSPLLLTNSSQRAWPPTGASSGGPNVVAIDNKIEQAMDLVKTHLTFAVREEVELLRSAIVELEAKVAQLEGENQVLKQFAPAEVVQSLSLLVQKQLQQLQTSSAPMSTVPSQSVIMNVTQQNFTASSIPIVEPLVVGSTSAPTLAELQADAAAAVAEQTAKMVDGGVIAR